MEEGRLQFINGLREFEDNATRMFASSTDIRARQKISEALDEEIRRVEGLEEKDDSIDRYVSQIQDRKNRIEWLLKNYDENLDYARRNREITLQSGQGEVYENDQQISEIVYKTLEDMLKDPEFKDFHQEGKGKMPATDFSNNEDISVELKYDPFETQIAERQATLQIILSNFDSIMSTIEMRMQRQRIDSEEER